MILPERPVLSVALCLMFAGAVSAQTSTTAGEFTPEPPTLVSLGFEWRIAGDDNRNAKVEVSYRKVGESSWHTALPLMRLQREEIGAAPGPNAANDPARYPLFRYTAANMFAGSILNLDRILNMSAASYSPIRTGSQVRRKKLPRCVPGRSRSPPKAVTCTTSIR